VAATVALLAVGFSPDSPAPQAAEPTHARPREWRNQWDAEVGLWWQNHPGHTTPVRDDERIHPAPSAAARLLLAAQARQLGDVDVMAVLRAIRRMQTLNGHGKGHGELRWYWEETGPVDHNGSFFTAMSLIALHYGHADQLTADQRQALMKLFGDLRVWFASQAAEREFYYPNRYLGDLVCAWLLGEVTGVGDADGKLQAAMLEAAEYWASHDWGWGEHLSDIYSGICLDELSALLLFSERLPPDVRRAYKSLFDDLLALDDTFGDLPRVPAIRTYAFTETPTRVRYRGTIAALPKAGGPIAQPATPVMPPEAGGVFRHRPPLGATLYEKGWHKLAPSPWAAGTDVVIPCHGGALATAHMESDVRIGSLSRFPVMEGTDQPKWGMSWQSAPVALLRREGDWGFLQWESKEGDRVRAHPANDMFTSYHDNALCADDACNVVGRTFSLQRGGDVLVVRRMPRVVSSWDRLTDRMRIVNAHATTATSSASDGTHRLALRYPQRTIGIQCVPLSPGARIELEESANGTGGRVLDWGVVYDDDTLAALDTITVVWGISVDGPIDTAPRILRPVAEDALRPAGQRRFELEWKWPKTNWHVRFDPHDTQPLREVAPLPAP
jgi:hypothetical protein